MSFYPVSRPVPCELRSDTFRLIPLTPAHVEIDYAAVMESKERLRLGSLSSWPREGFTLEENLHDLERHFDDHIHRRAFTYTILDPTGETCLGCLYIHPLRDHVGPSTAGELPEPIEADEAAVAFWIRSSLEDTPVEKNVLLELIGWLRSAWSFSRVLFVTHSVNDHQTALFRDAGLVPAFEVNGPGESLQTEYYSLSSS